ncbi:Serine-threonine/tyrosine-protein kinase [Theobroma cacao]|nr:Serine-threonine/tyrosine-protein kinase [Theobroma cacao]
MNLEECRAKCLQNCSCMAYTNLDIRGGGEGGFGPVYKGTLANGQEIAVKRLSKSSGQGLNEFKTEVKLIAKLQHRNLHSWRGDNAGL